MCGIAALWLRESVPSLSIIDIMFKWCEQRGVDGTGYTIIRNRTILKHVRNVSPYSECYMQVINDMPELKIGDIILMICRAAPETEPATTLNNMQPIVNAGCALVHNGAVSQKIYNELKYQSHYRFDTEIDSEAIISAYTMKQRNIKETMEYLSGGYAFVMVDTITNQMHVVNDFKPLATGYIKGLGYMVASDNNCLSEVVKVVTDCPRTGVNVWEYYYNNPQKGPFIRTVDIDSGFEIHQTFRPRFFTSTWDSAAPDTGEDLCIVSCSGGIDSSTTLATLKYAGYTNILAVHFNYGHRGSAEEKAAIIKVCDMLDVPLRIIDVSQATVAADSMLLNKNADVRTGTTVALKTTEAWVPGRNMIFMTYMASLGESLVMRFNYRKVYLLGGFLNLTESGTYPDNSEDFLRSFLSLCKYGTLIGDRFEPLYCLSNLMKSEQWLLIKALRIQDVIQHTISCDRPKMIDGVPHNCSKNGQPACGSGLLSWWGAKMVGMDDTRNFYEIEGDYVPHIPKHLGTGVKRDLDVFKVIDRILLPKDKKETLLRFIKNE